MRWFLAFFVLFLKIRGAGENKLSPYGIGFALLTLNVT